MTPGKSYFFFLIVFALFFSSCKDTATNSQPVSGPLDEVFASAAQIPNLKALVVFKDSQIVKEQYFHGYDGVSPHDVRSVTKSVTATLVGIAIEKGYIRSESDSMGWFMRTVNTPIDSVKAKITIRDLLTMSGGFSGNELVNGSEYDTWFNSPNQLAYMLNTPMAHAPGTTFSYNSGALHLLSLILTQETGLSTLEFARENLFQPLGIVNPYWQTDKQGFQNGAAGLAITPHDMLAIGRLYLDKGVWNGNRIMSEEWITKASTFKISTNNAQPFGPGYGYGWWTGSIHSHDYFFANGWGGQFIVVVPDIRLIVVATNTWSGVPTATANDQWYSTLDLIMNRILPLY